MTTSTMAQLSASPDTSDSCSEAVRLPSVLKATSKYSDNFMSSPASSLNELMANRVSLQAAHAAFCRDYEQRRKAVAFPKDSVDYGYDDYGYNQETDIQPPPAKRRRFQRRNSKTPQMLMSMSASLASLDFLMDDDDREDKKTGTGEEDEDNWDGGLQIAEELVKQLQNRRNSNR